MIRPFLCHYRYNGDIVCQGRAVVRVRIRHDVVRVQNRDTEIGAVVRTARASRDMTRFPFFYCFRRLAPSIYHILLSPGIFFGGRDVINIAHRFRFVKWRGTPAISASPSRRNRSVGCRICRVVGCQGRAAVRARKRHDAERVQNRDTEIGAAVRTARASRDIHVVA